MNFPKILVPAAMLASAVPAAYAYDHAAGTYWAEGVSQESGWFDATKTVNDSELCWAASAANIIAWWQAKADPSRIPSNAPKSTAADVFGDLKNTFNNEPWESYYAWRWYFGGAEMQDSTYDGGHYFKDSENSRTSGRYWESYVKECDLSGSDPISNPPYILGEDIRETYDTQGKSASFVDGVCSVLEDGGGVVLALVSPNSSWGHRITLWGVEITKDEEVLLWLTDSDDGDKGIFCCGLDFRTSEEQYGDGKDGKPIETWEKTTVYLKDYGTGNWSISGWSALMLPYAIPEPSAFGLLAGTLALALTASRRRRNKR